MAPDTGMIYRLEDYRPSDYLIDQTSLVFHLEATATRVIAVLDIHRRAGAPLDAPLVLDGDGLKLVRLELDGRPVDASAHEATPERLTLRLPSARDRFKLTIETEIDPEANKALNGLYRSNGIYTTQCEAEGFRCITYFLDRPDILSVYTVRIEADRTEAPILLSNGDPVEAGELGDGRHYAVWHDPHPKPSYLFALVAGDLGLVSDRFVTASGREVALGIYVEHGKEPRAAYAMDALKRSMRWDEEAFGREYDLDVFNIVAVSDFNMGAMENKGLNIFNDKYVLADEETATDADYANIEAIIAHEYFHNWTGNRITCRDWFQLCLKEGLTVFRDHEFSADQRSRAVRRIAEVRNLRAQQFPEDQGPLAHPVRPRRYREINNFYTATVYEKGSEVVRMLRTILGQAAFRAGMDLYFDRHDGQAVTIEDFLACFAETSGEDLTQFALWYHQAGTPNVTASATHDAARGELLLDIEQSLAATPSESRKKLMHIPLAFGLVGRDGEDVAYSAVEGASVEDGVIHLKKRRHSVRFSGVAEMPAISLNRGFSAPINLTLRQNAGALLHLALHDSDPFCRWQALVTMFTEALVAGYHALLQDREPDFDTALLDLPGRIAADAGLEEAYRALAITLPSETDIAREIGTDIEPYCIYGARARLARAIGDRNRDRFEDLHRSLATPGAFSPDAASAGRRALKAVLLDYLAASERTPARAAEACSRATNMTDRFAALAVLAHRFGGSTEADQALRAFESQFADDALVLDKWFMVQATMPGAPALDIVRKLMSHKAFDLTNPNRVRSLIGTYANANQTGFHRADGEGYRFFAETVLAIEEHNPQVAARLATAMRSWRSLEPVRRGAARAALETMAASKTASRDLADIVGRTLA
jgi:aminopeptidase N